MADWQVMLRDRVIQRFRLEEDQAVTIGRGADAEVRIDNPAVSRHHARLRCEGGRWILKDLGSTNGTFVNGQRIEGCALVSDGDRIEVAKFTLAPAPEPVRSGAALVSEDFEGTVAVRPRSSADSPGDSPFPKLVAVEGRANPGRLSLEGRGVVRIGRHVESDMRVTGFLVARTQCSIRARDGRYYLAHHSGVRCTTLNGQKLRGECRLVRGDTIGIGSSRLRFQ